MTRGTGKTTEMLAAALERVRSTDESVAVIVKTPEFVAYCKALLREKLGAAPNDLKRLRFMAIGDVDYRERGHKGTQLVDHDVWQAFATVELSVSTRQ